MSTENPVLDISLKAAADLSSAKFHFVTLDADRKVSLTASTIEIPFGVLQNAPVTDEPARVRLLGISKIYLSGTLATGALVTTTADGEAGADAAANYNMGVLTLGGADTELGEIFLGNFTVKA